MFERLSDHARKMMAYANQEAQRLNHEYIGTEHVLLGLVKEGSGTAAQALRNLDIDLRKIRLDVERLVRSGPELVTMGKLPQTPATKKVIEFAIEEARNLDHKYVGTEHLLLGLMRQLNGVAAQILLNLGLKLEKIREEIRKLHAAGAVEVEERDLLASPDPSILPTPRSVDRDNRSRTATLRDPTDLDPEILYLSKKLELLDEEKYKAVTDADYELAAELRDKCEVLRRQLEDRRNSLRAEASHSLRELRTMVPCCVAVDSDGGECVHDEVQNIVRLLRECKHVVVLGAAGSGRMSIVRFVAQQLSSIRDNFGTIWGLWMPDDQQMDQSIRSKGVEHVFDEITYAFQASKTSLYKTVSEGWRTTLGVARWVCDRHGSLTATGGNRVFRAASGVQILQPRHVASRGDLRAVPPGRYGRRPRSAAAPAGCGQAEKSHADDWLRPDRGVEWARIAGWARLSLKIARFYTLPLPPRRGPDDWGDAEPLSPPV